jgi:hypothetical protein
MLICDSVLRNKFRTCGSDLYHHRYDTTPDYGATRGSSAHPNAMCNLFPTEVSAPRINNPEVEVDMKFVVQVSCYIAAGSLQAVADKKDYLCILPNNVFNQYYIDTNYQEQPQ